MSDTSGAAIRRRIFLVSLAFLVPLVAPSARAQFLVAPQYPIALGGGGGGVASPSRLLRRFIKPPASPWGLLAVRSACLGVGHDGGRIVTGDQQSSANCAGEQN